MSRYDPSERLSPLEEAQAAKGTLDAHWARSYRVGTRTANWIAFRGRPDAAQCRSCGYFWTLENLEVKPNANGYLAQCLNCWIRENQPETLAQARKSAGQALPKRGRR